jgi:hypothetical protein
MATLVYGRKERFLAGKCAQAVLKRLIRIQAQQELCMPCDDNILLHQKYRKRSASPREQSCLPRRTIQFLLAGGWIPFELRPLHESFSTKLHILRLQMFAKFLQIHLGKFSRAPKCCRSPNLWKRKSWRLRRCCHGCRMPQARHSRQRCQYMEEPGLQ